MDGLEGEGNDRGEVFGVWHGLMWGRVPKHGGENAMENNGGEGVSGGDGGYERNANNHTGDEKTTKKWEADDRANER